MDAERIVRDHLATCLDGTDVLYAAPQSIAGRTVVVERTGGTRSEGVETATVAIQCYGDGRRGTALLADEVTAAVDELADDLAVAFSASVTSVFRDTFVSGPVSRDRTQVVIQVTLN